MMVNTQKAKRPAIRIHLYNRLRGQTETTRMVSCLRDAGEGHSESNRCVEVIKSNGLCLKTIARLEYKNGAICELQRIVLLVEHGVHDFQSPRADSRRLQVLCLEQVSWQSRRYTQIGLCFVFGDKCIQVEKACIDEETRLLDDDGNLLVRESKVAVPLRHQICKSPRPPSRAGCAKAR